MIGPQRVERHDQQVAPAAAEPRGGHPRAPREQQTEGSEDDEDGGNQPGRPAHAVPILVWPEARGNRNPQTTSGGDELPLATPLETLEPPG